MPDAINQLAFRLFDVESKGRITFGEGERRGRGGGGEEGERTQEVGRERGEKESERRKGGEREEGEEGRGRGWLVIWKVQVLGEGKVVTFGQFPKTWSKLLPLSYAALLYLIREL